MKSKIWEAMNDVLGKPTFSKAKWYLDDKGALCMDDEQIVHPDDFCRSDEVHRGHANLRLVALAPELLEELKIFVDIADTVIDDKSEELTNMIEYARDLIKRARSEK